MSSAFYFKIKFFHESTGKYCAAKEALHLMLVLIQWQIYCGWNVLYKETVHYRWNFGQGCQLLENERAYFQK
jgi:hypothetical protein